MENYYFQIIYWSRPSREGGNNYDLKKKCNIYKKKNAKIASIAGRHNVFTETFTIPKKN